MDSKSDRFEVIESSIQPASAGQWHRYAFTLDVRNKTERALTLTPDTALQVGLPDAHALVVRLYTETRVSAGETVPLRFDRGRVCGRLPPGNRSVGVRLIGRDVDGVPFAEQLLPLTTVAVEEADVAPVNKLGIATLRTFVTASATAEALSDLIVLSDDHYEDDVTVSWPEGVQNFDPLLPDGSVMPRPYVLRDLKGITGLAMRYRPRPGPQTETVVPIGVVLLTRPGIRCPHYGLGGMGSVGTHVNGVVAGNANLAILCANLETQKVQPGGTLHLNVAVSNSKPYPEKYYPIRIRAGSGATKPDAFPPLEVIWAREWELGKGTVSESSPASAGGRDADRESDHDQVVAHAQCGVRVLQDATDVTNCFRLESLRGPNFVGTSAPTVLTFVVRAGGETPPGRYQVYPSVASYVSVRGADQRVQIDGFVDGFGTDPAMWAWFDVER